MKVKTKMLPRFLTGLLAVLLFVAQTATVARADTGEEPFPDIASHWAYADIVWAAEQGIASGMPDGTFSPQLPLTRAMFLSYLARLSAQFSFNLNGYTETDRFRDLRRGSWYAKAIAWGSHNGIANGYGNGTFGPDDTLTREQMAGMLYQYLVMWLEDRSLTAAVDTPVAYRDSGSIAGWAKHAADALSSISLLQGTTNGTFEPKRDCTRAEAIAVIHRLFDYTAEHKLLNTLVYMKCGMNIYTGSAFGAFRSDEMTAHVLDFLYEQGFDHIRFPVNPIGWATGSETDEDGNITLFWENEQLDLIIHNVQMMVDRGFTVIIDFHDTGATLQNLDLVDGEGEPVINEGLGQKLLVAAWQGLAERTTELSDRVCFELVNEMELTRDSIEKCMDAIRQTGGNNADRTVLVYAYYWNEKGHETAPDLGKYESDPDIMFDIHNYEPFYFTHTNGMMYGSNEFVPGTRAGDYIEKCMARRLIAAGELQRMSGRKVLIGEYGVMKIHKTRGDFLLRYKEIMNENGLPSSTLWGAFNWWETDNQTVYDFVRDIYDKVIFDAMFGRG